MRPIIELENLQVVLGNRTILRGLQGSLRGRAIGLLGPDGAGKSTLINTLLGFHAPSSGTARLFGRDIRSDIHSMRRLIGYMPENDSFIADMTGVRFVKYMAELAGLPSNEAMERAHEAFFYVGLGEARYRTLNGYSLGMKQLAKLAQAIAHGPKLLFLDEPTNGLDPPARARMINLIREIRDTEDMHIVLSSHLLRDVEECCDEVIILKDGMVVGLSNLEEERKTNKKFLELETINAGPAFTQALEQIGCECATFGGGKLRLILPDGIQIKQIYASAAAHMVEIRRMNYRRDSLEDIFLKAMQPPIETTGPSTGVASNGRL